jgi:hypothetical protein
MKHSVVLRVGQNLVYQQAPTPKPTPGGSMSPVEFNRSLPEWEKTSKAYLIKKEDFAEFEKHIDVNLLNEGAIIPFELVETYEDKDTPPPRKRYARVNNNVQMTDSGGENPTFNVAFKCKLCEETQQVEMSSVNMALPICDQCFKDLKGIVLATRNHKQEMPKEDGKS